MRNYVCNVHFFKDFWNDFYGAIIHAHAFVVMFQKSLFNLWAAKIYTLSFSSSGGRCGDPEKYYRFSLQSRYKASERRSFKVGFMVR
jgi:hypothetical protein